MCISEIKQTIYSLIFFFYQVFEKIQPNKIVGSCSEVGKRREKRRRGKGKQQIQQPRVQFPTQFLFFGGPRNKWAESEKKEVNTAQISCIRARKLKVALFRAYLLTVFRDESAKVTSRKWSRLWEFWCYQNTKKILRFYSQHRFPTNCCWEIVLFLSPKKNLEAIQFIFIPE